MDDYVVDLTDVEEMGPIPDDIYVAEINNAEFGLSKASDTPMLTVTWTIVEGEFSGRKIYGDYWMLAGGAAWRTKQNLGILGYDPDAQISAQELSQDMIGEVARLRTKTQKSDEYGPQTRVARLLPLDDAFSTEGVAEEEVDTEGVPF